MPPRKASTASTPLEVAESARRKADAAAQAQHDERSTPVVPDVPNLISPAPAAGKASHRQQTRPADSGFVYGSPADLAERMGGVEGGTRMVEETINVPQTATVTRTPIKPEPQAPAEPLDNRGVPDLAALRRHNEEVADTMVITAQNNALAGVKPEDVLSTTLVEDGDRSLTTEGQLAAEVREREDANDGAAKG